MPSVALRLLLLFATACLALAPDAGAASRQIEVSHTYLMGDNESKSQARINCLNEAKRKAAEEAGVYVEVLSRSENFQLAHDEVQSFTAAILRIEILKEETKMVGESLALTLTVRAEIDPDEVKRKLEALNAERLAAKREKGLQPTPPQPTPALPVAPSPATTPARLPPAADPEATKAAIKAEIDEAQRRAATYVAPGMTRGEVEKLLGSPRTAKDGGTYYGYNYGRIWIVFKDELVACVRSRLEYSQLYQSELNCTGLAENFIRR